MKLKDVVEGLNLTDMKVHTDDDGEVRSIELKYEPNNRFTKGAQAFRSARAADEKVASSIAAALDAKAEQIKEYEKRFEPEPPEPDLPQEINAASPFTFEFYLAGIPIAQAMAAAARCSSDEMASAILKVIAQKPEPLSHQTNNWRKMHGLPMHRKPASFRRRRKTK